MDKFILGFFSGTTAVAVYGIAVNLYGMYQMFSTSTSKVFVPRVNRLAAIENNRRFVKSIFNIAKQMPGQTYREYLLGIRKMVGKCTPYDLNLQTTRSMSKSLKRIYLCKGILQTNGSDPHAIIARLNHLIGTAILHWQIFGGVDKIMPEMDDDGGTSLVFVNSQKGKQPFEEIKGKMFN